MPSPVPFRRRLKFAALVTALTFLVSLNQAWLNPNPGQPPSVKISTRVPLLWQYNPDSTLEIGTSAFFPEYYEIVSVRINRPTMHFFVRSIAAVVSLVSDPIVDRAGLDFSDMDRYKKIVSASISYVIFNYCLWTLAGAFFLLLASQWFASPAPQFGLFLFYTHEFMLLNATTFHTHHLQFISPIFLLLFLWDQARRPSRRRLILYSLCAGLLMLAKQNYAVYLAILGLGLARRRYADVLISAVVHLAPLAVWLIYLRIQDMPYYNYEAQVYRQGVWLYEELPFLPFSKILQTIWSGIVSFTVNVWEFYTLLLPAALLHCVALWRARDPLARYFLFFALLVALTWLQTFAAQRWRPYMSSDFACVIFACGAAWVAAATARLPRQILALRLLAGLWLAKSLLSLLHLPWIHPFSQG